MSDPWLRNLDGAWLLSPQDQGKNVAYQQRDWLSLWSILAPPKAKQLLWRISKGCLPTRVRLHERQVPCPLICPICDQQNEDEWHVLKGCVTNIEAWRAAGLSEILEHQFQHVSSAVELIHAICSGVDRATAGVFVMVIWVLWNNRNDKVWNDTAEAGHGLGIKARHLWEEWNAVQRIQQADQHGTQQQQQIIRWQNPPIGWYKCNDAGFHYESNKTSAGWCLRDHMGWFVYAGTTLMNGNCSIMEGESIALLEALKVMEQRGISHVVFETD